MRHHPEILLARVSGYAPPERRRILICYRPVSFPGLKVILGGIAADAELLALSQPTLPRTADQHILDRLHTLLPRTGTWHIYGASEIGACMTVKDGPAGFPARWLEEGLDPVRMRITDGVLEVARPIAMLGYLGTTMRRLVDPPDWWRTGDMIGIEGDRAYFLGRADSVINVVGAKVRPEEVEHALLRIPGVADARMFGRRNPITGQLVAAEKEAPPLLGGPSALIRSSPASDTSLIDMTAV